MTPRIGINALFLDPGKGGGMERYLKNLVAALAHQHPDMPLVAFTNRHNAGMFQGIVREIRSPVSARFRPARIIWEQTALPVLAGIGDCDLLISFGNTCPWVCPCPSVLVMHDLIPFAWPNEFARLERIASQTLFRMSAIRADHIVTVSQFSKTQISTRFGVPPEKISVIPGACDPDFCMGNKPPPLESVSPKWSRGKPYVLASASAHAHKNLKGLMAAWSILVNELGVRENLVITHTAGTDNQISEAAQAAGLKDRVATTGPVSDKDLHSLYTRASIFIYPSLYEGFGLPVLEAMACGVPVVACRTASLPEVAGEAAVLVSPDQPQKMAESIARILAGKELRNRLAALGREHAASFSWQKSAAEIAALVNGIARGGAS